MSKHSLYYEVQVRLIEIAYSCHIPEGALEPYKAAN